MKNAILGPVFFKQHFEHSDHLVCILHLGVEMRHLIRRKLQCCGADQTPFALLSLRYCPIHIARNEGRAALDLDSAWAKFVDREEFSSRVQIGENLCDLRQFHAELWIRTRRNLSCLLEFVTHSNKVR